jgi:hypothetical protein
VTDQLPLALADRHAGQAANLAAGTRGHADHRAAVEVALALCAGNGRAFTADDVHRLVKHEIGPAYDHNLVSSVMGRWARNGRIVEQLVPAVPSIHRSRRASRNRWWRGVTQGTPFQRAAQQ